jgi:hypothetical protein
MSDVPLSLIRVAYRESFVICELNLYLFSLPLMSLKTQNFSSKYTADRITCITHAPRGPSALARRGDRRTTQTTLRKRNSLQSIA